jgi:hypothetical protein
MNAQCPLPTPSADDSEMIILNTPNLNFVHRHPIRRELQLA